MVESWTMRAENEARTRDPNLGKVVLYQLSYFRDWKWRGGDSNSHASRHCHLKAARLPFRHLSISVAKALCPRQESNLHASRHTHLKRARLPIPPLGQAWSGKRGSNSRPQPWQGCALPTELFPHISVYALQLIFQLTSVMDGFSSELRCKGTAFFWMVQVF